MITFARLVYREISRGRIPCFYLILLISGPLWLSIAAFDITYKYLTAAATDASLYVALPSQRLLQHVLLYPLLVSTYWIAVKHGFSNARPGWKMTVQLSLAAAFAVTVYPTLFAVIYVTDSAAPHEGAVFRMRHAINPDWWLATIIEYFLMYLCGLFMIVCGTLYIRLQNERAARGEADSQYFKARIETLRNQINPHFLFNTLNAIAALLRPAPEKAEQILSGLGHLLKAGLGSKPGQFVPLDEELCHVADYMAIMQLRFEDVLEMKLDVASGLNDASVPDFLLVNLLENAFTHGGPDGTGRFRVEIYVHPDRTGDNLIIDMVNSVSPDGANERDGKGIGLRNSHDRLKVLYGAKARLVAGALSTEAWHVEITLPCLTTPPIERQQ